MPKGPNGQKRPADANACAVMVAEIATGDCGNEARSRHRSEPQGRIEGREGKGCIYDAGRRLEIAKRAVSARWKK
jgi:hypothetical protein